VSYAGEYDASEYPQGPQGPRYIPAASAEARIQQLLLDIESLKRENEQLHVARQRALAVKAPNTHQEGLERTIEDQRREIVLLRDQIEGAKPTKTRIRVLRVMEYWYDTAWAMEDDMSHWKVQGTLQPRQSTTIKSITFSPEFWKEA
jgi:hypothetical protein